MGGAQPSETTAGKTTEELLMPVASASCWLFCPADRPERYQRALETAEVVIIDLEDAVALEAKSRARRELIAVADQLDPDRVVVRVNRMGTSDGDADLSALAATSLRTIMLPKVESAGELDDVGDWDVVALCESAEGVESIGEVAQAEACVALTWGSQDLALNLGAAATRDDHGSLLPFAEYARTRVRYAAAAAGIPAVDTVWVAIDDLDGLHAEARSASLAGFAAKMVIHPSHVEPVREAFRPTADQIEAARRVLEAADTIGDGASALDGLMLDVPIVEQARAVLRRAGG